MKRSHLVALSLSALLLGCSGPAAPPSGPLLAPLPTAPTAPPRDEGTTPARALVPRAPAKVVEAPPAPPVRPIDPTLPSDGFLLLGSNATHAWLTAVVEDRDPHYTVVVDLARGCAVESYPQTKAQAALRNVNNGRVLSDAARAQSAPDLLASPDARAELRDLVGLGRRFGLTKAPFDPLVWSKDGLHIFVVDGRLHHSADGGHSYEVVDTDDIYSPVVTPDGRYVVYERCVGHTISQGTLCPTGRQLASWSLDGSSPPRTLFAGGGFHNHGLSNDGHVILTRSGGTSPFCVEFADPATGKIDRSVCTTIPPTKAPKQVGIFWKGASPGERYGSIEWWETRPQKGATIVLAITDMQDGHIIRTVEDVAIRGWDDAGTVLLSSMQEGGGDHTYLEKPGEPRKRLGSFLLHDFDPATRRAIVDGNAPRKSTLGKTACKIAKVIRVP